MDSDRNPIPYSYSAKETKFTHLPFGHNGKTQLELNPSAKSFMFTDDHAPPGDVVGNVVPPIKTESQAPTTTTTLDAELSSSYDQEEPCDNFRAHKIADGIKRLALMHEDLGLEIKKEKTRLAHHVHERSEKDEVALQENRRSVKTPREDTQVVSPKPQLKHTNATSPEQTDGFNDSSKSLISPGSACTGGKFFPYSLASQADSRNSKMINNDVPLSKGRIGQVLSSDEISLISDFTMEDSEYLMKPMTVSRTDLPPPPKRQNLLQKASKSKAHPPPPPKRQNLLQKASKSKAHPPPPPRLGTSFPSSSSKRSKEKVAPRSPLPMRAILKAPSPHPPPLTRVGNGKPSLAHSSVVSPDISSHRQECAAAIPPLPHKKSLRRVPPPPPPRSKSSGKSSTDSPFLRSCPDNSKLCSSDSDGGDFTNTTSRTLPSSEKDFSSSASSGKPSHKPIQTLMSEEVAYASLGDSVTVEAKPSSFSEFGKSRYISPPPRFSLNLVGKDDERGKTLLLRKTKSFSEISDLDRVRASRRSSSSDSKKDACMSSFALHDKPNERGKCTPMPKDRGAGMYEKHATTRSWAPTSFSKPKSEFDKNGRCLQHPSVIVAKKKVFRKGWHILQDGCHRCMQEYSNTSFTGSDMMTTKGAHSPIGASKSTIGRSNSREHRTSPSQISKGKHASVAQAIVSKMPYTTSGGKSGWYSGEVSEKGIPHGTGMMYFKDGNQYDGQWINGCSGQSLDKIHRLKSGFSDNRSPSSETGQPDNLTGSRCVKMHPENGPSGNMQPYYYRRHAYPPPMQYQLQYGGALYPQQYWY